MILNIDVTGKEFQVTQASRPKLDPKGEHRTDRATGLPLWSTQVVVTDDDGGEIINIATKGLRPDIDVGDLVDVVNLVTIPWSTKERAGIAYRAESIKSID